MRLSRVRIGTWLLAVGAVHLAATPVFFGDALRSVVEGGVLFSVEADAEATTLRASGFWYATSGVAVMALGLLSRHSESQLGSPAPVLPPTLLGLGAWGVLLDPQSGFWLFFPIAVLAWLRVRSARRSTAVAVSVP
ncbi:DUF6463 family protein [Nocardioides pantholopis]|uniref:DUF6463 family protein n=1 Tax=Nocardioides pantholopis TaxID=2483798 RepID=UPI000F085F92|nr:DUF6463 family protein [Nocardioides pantholopis]